MGGFDTVFGGSSVQPSNVSYLALALSANLTFVWPPQAPTGSTVAARLMDVTPSGAGFSITMPPANAASIGYDMLVTNPGAYSFTILNNSGGVIASIAPGQQYYIYLQNNTTTAGTWNAVLFAAASSTLTASAIAGTGTIAIGATLSPNFVTSTSSASPLNISSTTDRSAQYVWTGGTGVVNLPALSSLPSPKGYFVILNNKGTGVLTVTPNGSDTVDGNATEALNPGYAAMYFAGPTQWYSFGFLSSTKFNFTELVQTVTGGTLTLTQTQAANVVQKYQGTLTSNQTVVFPPIVQVYYVQNATAGAFNLTFNCGAGTSVTVPSGQNAVLFTDGTNTVNASTTVSGIASLLLGAGSVSTPAIGFSANPSTGIYQPSTGNIGFTVNGTETVNFGAGTTTFNNNVVVSAPASGVALQVNGVAGTDIADFLINENNARSIVASNPNTGVSAGVQFYVSATPGSVTNAGGFAANQYGVSANSYGVPFSINASGSNIISFNTNGIARQTISGAGNVSIAAPTSGTALSIAGVNTASAPLPLSITGSTNTTPGQGSAAQLQAYQAAWSVTNAASTQNWYFGVNDASSNQLQIGSGYSAAQGISPNITIATTGSITAISPSAGQTLLVDPGAGSNNSLSVYAGTANLALDLVGSTNTNNPSTVRFLNNAYSSVYGEIYFDATQGILQTQAASPLLLGANSVNYLSIASGGLATFSCGAFTTEVTLTWGATTTLNCNSSNDFYLVMGGNVTTLTISNPHAGQGINLRIKQPSSGGPYTMAWPANFRWTLGAAPILSTAASAEDMYVGQYSAVDSTWIGSLMKGVQ